MRVSRQIYKRYSKEHEGNRKQHRRPPLMLNIQERSGERDDDKQGRKDRTNGVVQNRAVQKPAALLQPRQIGLERRTLRIVDIVFKACDLSIARFMRPISTEVYAARAPQEKRGRRSLRDPLGELADGWRIH
jgi:hypothetical protein